MPAGGSVTQGAMALAATVMISFSRNILHVEPKYTKFCFAEKYFT